jgi:hypothetical protein
MTEPVEGWIRRAAERCAAIGLSELAGALTGHAQAEAGHHLMMMADVRSLAAHWNARREPAVDADKLLNQTLSPGVLRYCKVHEENIAGDTPYAQIAIEYEVEMLPLRYGEPLLNRCVEMLGAEILSCLSFVTEHIVLDVAHELQCPLDRKTNRPRSFEHARACFRGHRRLGCLRTISGRLRAARRS